VLTCSAFRRESALASSSMLPLHSVALALGNSLQSSQWPWQVKVRMQTILPTALLRVEVGRCDQNHQQQQGVLAQGGETPRRYKQCQAGCCPYRPVPGPVPAPSLQPLQPPGTPSPPGAPPAHPAARSPLQPSRSPAPPSRPGASRSAGTLERHRQRRSTKISGSHVHRCAETSRSLPKEKTNNGKTCGKSATIQAYSITLCCQWPHLVNGLLPHAQPLLPAPQRLLRGLDLLLLRLQAGHWKTQAATITESQVAADRLLSSFYVSHSDTSYQKQRPTCTGASTRYSLMVTL